MRPEHPPADRPAESCSIDARSSEWPVRLRIGERVDPDAADALWAVILNPDRSRRPGSGGGDAGR